MAEDKKDERGSIPKIYWRYLAAFLAASIFIYGWNIFFNPNAPSRTVINYSQFIEQLSAGNIKSVSIKKELVNGELIKEASVPLPGEKKSAQVKYFQTVLPSFQGEGLLSQLKEKNVIITIEPAEQGLFWQMAIGFLPWVLIIGFWVLMTRRSQRIQGGPGGLFTFGASKAKLYVAKKPSVTFKDVAGMDNVKMELRETIDFLKDPSRFEKNMYPGCLRQITETRYPASASAHASCQTRRSKGTGRSSTMMQIAIGRLERVKLVCSAQEVGSRRSEVGPHEAKFRFYCSLSAILLRPA